MEHRTLAEKISDEVTQFVGSWLFIFISCFFFAIWISLNTLTFLEVWHFDVYPYIFLNLLLSFIAAFQAPFIMMSQKRAEKKQDLAYRSIFKEIKELVHEDLDMETEIQKLEKDIKRELELMKSHHAELLAAVKKHY